MAPVPNQPLQGPGTCLLLTYLRFCATVSRRLCATCWPTRPYPSLPRGRTRPRKGPAAVLFSPGPFQKVTSTRNMLRIELRVSGSKHGSSKFLPATPLRNLAIRLFSRCPANQSVRLSNKMPHKSPGINWIAKNQSVQNTAPAMTPLLGAQPELRDHLPWNCTPRHSQISRHPCRDIFAVTPIT